MTDIDIVDRLRFDAIRCEAQFSKGVAGNITEAADEIERLRARPQPIETAPKDGSHILAWRIPVGIRVTNNTHPPTVVHWFNDPGEPGFYTSVNERAPEHPFNPTHWKPLDVFA